MYSATSQKKKKGKERRIKEERKEEGKKEKCTDEENYWLGNDSGFPMKIVAFLRENAYILQSLILRLFHLYSLSVK